MEINDIAKALRSIHPFPARMAPTIAMSELTAHGGTRLKVLDPMVGSGTTTVLSRLLGHRAYGLDIDPLAVLLSGCWVTSANSNELLDAANEVLTIARRRARYLKDHTAYPSGANDETKQFVKFWFDCDARIQLRAIADAISDGPPAMQGLLWVALSRTIITKAKGVSLAMDLSHSRPHRVYTQAPVRPFDVFLNAVRHVVSAGPFIDERKFPKSRFPEANISIGDARKTGFRSCFFDLVITSPPYLNAIDYIRCSKFALVWMGRMTSQLREIRNTSIGSEAALDPTSSARFEDYLSQFEIRRQLPKRWSSIIDRYILDMYNVVAEVARVLKPGGTAVFVVGDSKLQGVPVSNSRILERTAASAGLCLEKRSKRALVKSRRYLPPPNRDNGKIGERMGHEVILRFSRR